MQMLGLVFISVSILHVLATVDDKSHCKTINIGDHIFEASIEIIESSSGGDPSFIIRAVETTNKDIFEFKQDAQYLFQMDWPNNSLDGIKEFIESALFRSDQEITVQMGFNNNTQDDKSMKLSTTYKAGDEIIILIALKYKHVQLNWKLKLKYIAQDEVKRLKLLVNELKSFQAEFKGMITMWNGEVSNIPKGWVLCDGRNGTPDLRNRFIMGGDTNIGHTGGDKTHSHTASVNGHTLTINQIPQHQHKMSYKRYGSGIASNGEFNLHEIRGGEEQNDGGYQSSYTGGGQSHSHSASINSKNHIPPYYILAFIMKL